MKTYKFTARIEAGNGGGAGAYFPYDVEKEFGTKGAVPVQATFNGVPYSGSLMKCGPSQHMLGILKAIREQIGKQPGDLVEVEGVGWSLAHVLPRPKITPLGPTDFAILHHPTQSIMGEEESMLKWQKDNVNSRTEIRSPVAAEMQ